jgi:NAD-reducing hydrogenase large subunit
LNICATTGTPLADLELDEYRQRGGRTVTASFWYHYARLIEILTALEHIERLLSDPEIASEDVLAHAGVNRAEGVGAGEAPRGTLFHHYQVDGNGLLTRVNMIIATGQNNLAMNRATAQIARHFIKGETISEGVLNRLEAGIRAFDPCLSCSTHAFGQMPLHVQLVGADGTVLDEVWRH